MLIAFMRLFILLRFGVMFFEFKIRKLSFIIEIIKVLQRQPRDFSLVLTKGFSLPLVRIVGSVLVLGLLVVKGRLERALRSFFLHTFDRRSLLYRPSTERRTSNWLTVSRVDLKTRILFQVLPFVAQAVRHVDTIGHVPVLVPELAVVAGI